MSLFTFPSSEKNIAGFLLKDVGVRDPVLERGLMAALVPRLAATTRVALGARAQASKVP